MNGAYGGLIIIIIYGSGNGIIDSDQFLITQDNKDILTQASQQILVQE